MNKSPQGTPARDATQQSVGADSAALALLTSALWGGTPTAIKYSVETLPPLAVAGWRFALGALFMLAWCRAHGTELRLRPGQWWPSLAAGLLLFLQISLFNIGVKWSNASHGAMLINTYVLWVVALEHFVTRSDRLSARKTFGLIIAASGVMLALSAERSSQHTEMATTTDAASLAGDLVLLASALLLGFKLIWVKRSLQHVEPGKLILWHDIFGVALFAACSVAVEDTSWQGFQLPAVLGLLYQGVLVAGLCFAIQTSLLRKHSASQIAVFSFATPLFGIALGVLLRHDRLSPWLFVAGVCVALAIYLVSTAPRTNRC